MRQAARRRGPGTPRGERGSGALLYPVSLPPFPLKFESIHEQSEGKAMKETDVKISTGPNAGNSLGLAVFACFHSNEGRSGAALETLNFDRETKALQAEARARGASAVTGVSFQVTTLPGGLYVVATGTLEA